MFLRKRRAVRLPLTDTIRNDMIENLPPYAQKAKFTEENSPYNNGDVAIAWIQSKYKQTSGETPFHITVCDNGNVYLDLVFSEEDVRISRFITAKCRALHRYEKYQISTTDCYLDQWMDSLRMVEYMYDIYTNFHEDCYTSLLNPDDFYREQKIVEHQIVDEKLVSLVEQTALKDLFAELFDMDDLNGKDSISQAVLFDRFIVNKANRSIYWTYYNPDSNSGGQFVHNTVTFDQINEENAVNPETFFDNLGSVAKQTLVDMTDNEFIDTAYQILTDPADFIGCTFSTMAALKLIVAQK